MIKHFTLGNLLVVLVLSSSTQAETLKQLRENHQQAYAISLNIENPKLGTDRYREKLGNWADSHKKSQLTAKALIPALFNHWIDQPNDQQLKNEIESVYNALAGRPTTERHNKTKSFMSRIAWPLLANGNLTTEQSELVAKLVKPSSASRISDVMARMGMPTEAYGWDQQAVYALALIRLDKEKQARSEISSLYAKAATNYKANPKGGLDYGHGAGPARYRDYVDYLQLCKLLRGFQDSFTNDHKGAIKHVTQAQNLRKKVSPEGAILIAEINRRSESGKNEQLPSRKGD